MPEPEYGWPDLWEDGAIGFRPAQAVDVAASMFPALEPTADPTQAEFGEALTELGDGSGRWIDRRTGEVLTRGPKRFTLTISGGLIRVAVNDVRTGQTDDLDLIDAGDLDHDEELWTPELHDDEGDGTSSVVEGFSRRSRNRCRAVGASLDWAGAKRPEHFLLMVTLTYPGDWRACAPTPDHVLRHRRALELRFYRATGHRVAAMWKREFQDRGAPHIHLFGWWPWRIGDLALTQWLSTNWFEIVNSGDAHHLLAGTGVDHRQSIKMSDPNRVGNYFASYMAKGKYKDYQNQAPADWTNPNGSVGRYWGYVGLERLAAEVPITQADMVEVERLLRGVLASQKRTHRTRLSRKGKRPDGLRKRMVSRRYKLPTLKGTGRGFMFLTNDGAHLAYDIARALDLPKTELCPEASVGHCPDYERR